ncbi:MAG TPA: sigma-70 family RNA polymerase sigma factor, partial [Planctomycetota bacterium]|nr:sigma-70 family RNA polymerase sigma factor [Planctomycetota bacterium]
MGSEPIHSLREELPLQAEWVRRLARRFVRDEAAAEDLAQEAALASLRARNPLRGALRPWLGRVASNLAQRGWRDAETRRRGEREAARPEALPGPVEVLSRLEIQGQLVEELKQLEEPLRSVVVRHFFDGWSLVRIARHVGVPASTVSGQLQRALAEMRARLDRRQSRDGIRWRPAILALAGPRFPWLAPHGPAATVLGPLQGALAMKLTTQIVLVGVVLATGLGVYLATDTEAPEVAAQPVAVVPVARDAELPASTPPELELEQPASRE